MSEERFAVDTSVAVPLLIRRHDAHAVVSRWAAGKMLCLSGHAAAEVYSVLTRLPMGARVSADDAVRAIDGSFPEVLTLSPGLASVVHRELASCGVVGGAAYDGLVALAAREHDVVLVTRDARARSTYEAVGVRVQVLVCG